jgi:hypothetical protein
MRQAIQLNFLKNVCDLAARKCIGALKQSKLDDFLKIRRIHM